MNDTVIRRLRQALLDMHSENARLRYEAGLPRAPLDLQTRLDLCDFGAPRSAADEEWLNDGAVGRELI